MSHSSIYCQQNYLTKNRQTTSRGIVNLVK